MKLKHIPAYFLVGLIGFVVFGMIGLSLYSSTYARESYNIADCSKKYQFLNMTISRDAKWGAATLLSYEVYALSTVLFIYPTNELQEKGFLDTLYSEATNDPEVFLNYEERNTDDAVVLLERIPSPNEGEEPIYCVVGKEDVSVAELLKNQDIFSVGLQWKHTKRDLLSTEDVRRVISWGPSL